MNKSIKVCFCAINSKYIHSSLAPWCLVAGVKKWGNGNCTAVVCETTINAPETDILAQLEREQPNLIGISTYIWNITYVKNILPKIKQLLPNAKILLGGPEVSYNPAEVFETVPQVDYIICGEGEKPVAELLNFLSCNFDEKIEPQPLQYPKIGEETATAQADQSGETATAQADQT
ncbi:MAG: cobalamin B12-binding domain-containing protein, partial [Oscillospiraceae bacterium]